MKFERLAIPEVILVTPPRFEDSRGFFSETFRQSTYSENGIHCAFVQDNHSLSVAQGTLRGFHFQAPPYPQDKLVRCTRGRLLDIAVDLRHGSPTYLQSVQVELTPQSGQQLFVPAGFAHGFLTLEPNTEAQYRVSNYYDPELDLGIAFDDPDIAFEWPVPVSDMMLSDRDSSLPKAREIPPYFQYEPAEA